MRRSRTAEAVLHLHKSCRLVCRNALSKRASPRGTLRPIDARIAVRQLRDLKPALFQKAHFPEEHCGSAARRLPKSSVVGACSFLMHWSPENFPERHSESLKHGLPESDLCGTREQTWSTQLPDGQSAPLSHRGGVGLREGTG